MVELINRLHQIATFLSVFPKTPIMAIFYAIMAKWPYSQMPIMATNVAKMSVFGNGKQNVAMW